MSQWFTPNCPVCGKFHDNITSNCRGCNASLWQPATHTRSEPGASSLVGTSNSQTKHESQDLLEILQQITALQSRCAGAFSSQSINSLYLRVNKEDIGYALEKQISASIAKAQQDLMDLYTHVLAAETGLIVSSKKELQERLYPQPPDKDSRI